MKTFSALLAVLSITLPVVAQDMPQPGPQHKKLAANAGTWDATLVTMGADGQPMKSTGVSIVKVALGGFWIVDDFTADFMGMKYQGHGMSGYDPIKGKYVSTWSDSMSPQMSVMEGNYDKTGKILTMTGMGVQDGQPTRYRYVTTETNANLRTFEMYVDEGKQEMKTMTITYKRRPTKAKDAKAGRRR